MEKSVPEVDEAKVKLVEVTLLIVRNDILLLNVVQLAAVSNPLFEAEAEGKLKVIVAVLVEIVKSVPVVEEAMVKVLAVTPLMVVVTCGLVLVKVIVPVAEEIDIPVPADSDCTPVLVIVGVPVAEETDIPVPAVKLSTPLLV
jgi:hypothetical protein